MHLTDNALRRGRSNQCDSPRGSGGGPNARSADPGTSKRWRSMAPDDIRPIADLLVHGRGSTMEAPAGFGGPPPRLRGFGRAKLNGVETPEGTAVLRGRGATGH